MILTTSRQVVALRVGLVIVCFISSRSSWSSHWSSSPCVRWGVSSVILVLYGKTDSCVYLLLQKTLSLMPSHAKEARQRG